jgi:hypothetical protein
MGRLEQLRSLSRDERRNLASALFWLPATRVLLRLIGFKRTLGFYQQNNELAAQYTPVNQDLDTATMVARMISIAANHGLYRARCLPKSLVLVKFLQARDIASNLKIGARCQGEEFGAHAWVECGGVAINESTDVENRYAVFDTPSGRPTKTESHH